ALLLFLVNWGLVNFKIGEIALGGVTTTWLWAPLAAFWLWNVRDARAVASDRRSSALAGVFFAAIILYVLAWNVTDIKLERLITRFADFRKVAVDIVNPDLFSITVEGETRPCSWGCILEAVRSGRLGAVAPSENFGDILGRFKPVEADGRTATTFIPGKLFETIAIGLLATIFSIIVAVPLSFFAAHNIMARVWGGTAIYYVMRTFLNVVRAVDTVIWALLIIVWVGLGNMAGIIALTIHSVAALGKLYSEEIEHIDPGPVEAVTATGANLFQVLRYAVVPQIIPPFLAYSLLRWDINMRAATVVGFVAGGGIGFFVVETIRLGAYPQYAAALWGIAAVIIAVDAISARWRESILRDQSPAEVQAPRPWYASPRTWGYILLFLALFVGSWRLLKLDARVLLEPAPTFGRLVRDFVTIDLSPEVLDIVIKEILVTIFQALLATTFGGLAAIPFSFLAAKNLTGRSRLSRWIYYATRGLFNVLRSIEALLYVAIFVFWVGIGPFAGVLGLAVTAFALLGKLFSEAIENIDAGPIEAITATGPIAGRCSATSSCRRSYPPSSRTRSTSGTSTSAWRRSSALRAAAASACG
ncbi:MAG: phosphonate ABC transporter, permease protein PhnE, partial [Anaerolineae bacterium]